MLFSIKYSIDRLEFEQIIQQLTKWNTTVKAKIKFQNKLFLVQNVDKVVLFKCKSILWC